MSTPVDRWSVTDIVTVWPAAAADPTGRPLARVRFTNGSEFTGWRHIPHDDLLGSTGRPLGYWERIDAHARVIVSMIEEYVIAGELPPVTCFAELHASFDPNLGWSPEIDALPEIDWIAVQWRATDLLRTG